MARELCRYLGGNCSVGCENLRCPFLSPGDFSVVRRFRNEAILNCPSPTCNDFERNFCCAVDLATCLKRDESGTIYGCDTKGNRVLRVHPCITVNISQWINGAVEPVITFAVEKNPHGDLMSLGIGLRNAVAFPNTIPFALSCNRDGTFTAQRPVRPAHRNSFMTIHAKFLTMYKKIS